MKTIVTLDKANKPFGFPQLNQNGNFDNIVVNTISAATYQNVISSLGYKVYTALLTQRGGVAQTSITNGDIPTSGVTYTISIPINSTGADFSNIGAPNNSQGTVFVATKSEAPNSWGTEVKGGTASLLYNLGAPTVIVLQNTIGNVWWTSYGGGEYYANSDNLFTPGKTWVQNVVLGGGEGVLNIGANGNPGIMEVFAPNDDILTKTPIEIRVYD